MHSAVYHGRGRGLLARSLAFCALTVPFLGADRLQAQGVNAPFTARLEQAALGKPFTGLTTDGTAEPGLYSIRSTGVSTGPVRLAMQRWVDTLSDAQRAKTLFPVDSPEWRKWANMHLYDRAGTSFKEMNAEQRSAAFDLLKASLSAKGLKLSRDIMRLNETVAEMTGKHDEYGEDLYWITAMGTPSETEPWGFQLEGHHLALNYFVLGDQVVLSPMFLGSEPVSARAGKYAGTEILQAEQDQGLAFFLALDAGQQEQAILLEAKRGSNNQAEAFKDNVVSDYEGIKASALRDKQRQQLLSLIALYVGNLRPGHAEVRLEEVRAHLDDTWFAWTGSAEADGAFYYRIHSPVIWIEFDHQRPIAFERTGTPSRDHVHVVVRTPNGNDYGKELLRQHLLHQHKGGAAHVN